MFMLASDLTRKKRKKKRRKTRMNTPFPLTHITPQQKETRTIIYGSEVTGSCVIIRAKLKMIVINIHQVQIRQDRDKRLNIG